MKHAFELIIFLWKLAKTMALNKVDFDLKWVTAQFLLGYKQQGKFSVFAHFMWSYALVAYKS